MVSPIITMRNWEKHSGISGIPTQLLVLHSGESPLRGGYAQSLTNWANTPLAQGGPYASWHWFVDPIAIVSQIDPNYAAWHASEANPMSEGFEQSGYARFSRAEWLTPEGLKQIDNLGWLMAQRAKACGIPMVWLTTAQVNAITSGRDRKTKGFCTHRQIDPDTRYDPGDGYPFDVLTAKVNSYLSGTTPKEDTLSATEVKAIKDHINAVLLGGYSWRDASGKLVQHPGIGMVVEEEQRRASRDRANFSAAFAAQAAQIKGLVGAVAALAKGEAFDEAKLLAGIEAAAAKGAEAGAKLALQDGVVTVDVNVNGSEAQPE
jgi:hypothetical protein